MYILCSPVFVPHITGGLDPDEPEMVKLSVLPKKTEKALSVIISINWMRLDSKLIFIFHSFQ